MADHIWALVAPTGLLLLNALVRGGHQLSRSLPADAQVLEALQGSIRNDYAAEMERKARLAIAYSRYPVFAATDPFILLAFCLLPVYSTYEALKGLGMGTVYVDPITATMMGLLLALVMPLWLAFFSGWEYRANGRAEYIREHVSAESDSRFDHLLSMRILLVLLKGLALCVLLTTVVVYAFYIDHMNDIFDDGGTQRAKDYAFLGVGALITSAIFVRFSSTRELTRKLPRLSDLVSGGHQFEHPRNIWSEKRLGGTGRSSASDRASDAARDDA